MKKRCPKCGKTKELNNFYTRGGKRSDEVRSYCKECVKLYSRIKKSLKKWLIYEVV